MSSPTYNAAALKLVALRERIIGEIWQHPCYQALIDELNSRRPQVPYWNPKEDNTEELKYASAQQKWHDVMMAIIDPNKKYETNPKGKAE